MDVDPAVVAGGEAAEAAHPSQRAFDDPPMPAQPSAALDPAARDARLDPAAARIAAAPVVVGLVAMGLFRPAARAARLARHGQDHVEQVVERGAVVDVGPGQREGERGAAPVRDELALGAGLAAVRRVRPDRAAPLSAGMDALLTQARLQSIRSAPRSRHQQVTPDPHPISPGSISHEMPKRSTNRMPVSAARLGTAGRPPRGFGGSGGGSGAMTV
jgi:hypothetical protein